MTSSAFEHADRIAKQQGAMSLQLRAQMSMVTWQRHRRDGGTDVAAAALKATLEQFKEGFDTADLLRARATLEAPA